VDGDGHLDTVATPAGPVHAIYDAGGNLLIQTSPSGSTLYLATPRFHVDSGV